MDKPILEINGVSFSYNKELVLEDINLTVHERDFVWIVGPNGGGKTTLMKILIGLLSPSKGSVELFGDSPRKTRSRVGYMPQHSYIDHRFPITVLQVALMGRLKSNMRTGQFSSEDHRVALNALEQVGIADLAKLPFGELSGGQQRRLLIGRALTANPEILLLDEPTANLDRRIEKELYDLLKRLNQKLTIVVISHDPAFVSEFVKQVVCINHTLRIHPTTIMENRFSGDLYGSKMRMVRHDQHHNDDDDKNIGE
ncbi:MAG: ABC transporter ATP-binding protein [candidate division Zixibacteria bacterium]|nr:ABC transporter ATP-binding protein [candidate division Zixibacteria bacterium]